MSAARQLCAQELVPALAAARQATLQATMDLDDAAWRVPFDPGIQPTAWDLAHIGWFAEFWLLRGPHRTGPDLNVHAERPPVHLGPDAQYDSARVAHRDRWTMRLHARGELQQRLAAQLAACSDAIAALPDDDDALHHARFALYHELMHVEALWWTRALLGLPAPAGAALAPLPEAGEVQVDGGEVWCGAPPGERGFWFDNELAGRRVRLAAFAIDRTPVHNGWFRRFVADAGYRRAEFWPGAAGTWRAQAGREMPERWRHAAAGGFEQRWFDRWMPLDDRLPVIHVNAWEAEAFCRWAGRRLPTAAEWEHAAPRLVWGHSVWEWTADAFAPYPGFRPAPYTTYSAPWFHHQRELRGGAYATHELMHERRYRNFFLPRRTDVFAGFRTVAQRSPDG